MSSGGLVLRMGGGWERIGKCMRRGVFSHGRWKWEYLHTHTNTHTNLSQTPTTTSSYWEPDSLGRRSMLTEIKGGHHTRARSHTHTHTRLHTHTHTNTHQTYSAPPNKQLGSLRCTSLSSATVVLPASLPIRELLLLPRWLHPSMPLTAWRGVLLVEAAGSLFWHTAPTPACSNATPLWGQRKRVALTCIMSVFPVLLTRLQHTLAFISTWSFKCTIPPEVSQHFACGIWGQCCTYPLWRECYPFKKTWDRYCVQAEGNKMFCTLTLLMLLKFHSIHFEGATYLLIE